MRGSFEGVVSSQETWKLCDSTHISSLANGRNIVPVHSILDLSRGDSLELVVAVYTPDVGLCLLCLLRSVDSQIPVRRGPRASEEAK